MNDFNKVVRIGTIKCYEYSDSFMSVYCKIEYKDGNLSITGVEGPLGNGSALGSCGQLTIDPNNDSWMFADGWNAGKVTKFVDLWERWHLNNMQPCNEHQRKAGLMTQAKEIVDLYHFVITVKIRKEVREAEKQAIACIQSGKTFSPTDKQIEQSNMLTDIVQYNDETCPTGYQKETRAYGRNAYHETKTRGWISWKENKQYGLLGKPCDVVKGDKYGSAWYKVDVPKGVLKWLNELPNADKAPMWV